MRVFGWLVVLALGAAAPATAQQGGIDDYLATATRFEAYVAASAAGGALPRMDDREARAMLRRLTDMRATFGRASYTPADLERLGSVLERAMATASLYMQHNVDPTSASPETQTAQGMNIVTYQNEVMPLLGFALDAAALIARTQARAFEGGVTPDEATRARLVQMRGGIQQMLNGVIGLSAAPGISFENRLVALRAISRNAPTFAVTLSVAQREEALAALNANGESDNADVARETARAMAGLTVESCTGFCPL